MAITSRFESATTAGASIQRFFASKPGHYGLIGIRERASRIGATLSFHNLSERGTEVTLVIPGRIAFNSPAGNHFRKLKSLFTPAAVRRLDL